MASGKKVRDFRPASRNANKHTARGMGALQKSIQTDGWIGAMTTAADGEMIAGSARIETVAQVWGTDAEPIVVESDGTRPVVVVRTDIPSADDKRAQRLALADNRVHEIDMSWDVEVLAGFDADVLGELWTPEELSDLGQQWADEQRGKQEDAGAQIDKAEELRVKWGVESGQLWQLGEHRLICGDCTDAATVARVMGGERAALAPVDPPYNVSKSYDGETVDDNKSAQDYEAFSRAWFAVCQSVSERQIVTPGLYNLASWLRFFDAKHWGTWIKRNTQTHGLVTMFLAWEPVLFFGQKWKRTRQLDIFDYPAQFSTGKETFNHPCPKPLAMWEDLVTHYSEPNDVVYEAFSGSGTTLIACERLGRKCRAVEISPGYVAVALERWAQTTGKTPILANGA